jgi:excinuclease ABC subunit A
MQITIDQLDPKQFIIVKGAKVNNLKNLSVAIPRNKLVVITGVSGSGKSSLAFDTLFAEGQRMYVESLSSYARQFLGRMEKPEVDYIKGVSPAIAVEQKVNTRNPRSTVGTTTEIYDYLKLFFARIGKTYSPVSGVEVKKDSVSDVVDYICKLEDGLKVMILSPFKLHPDRSLQDELKILLQKGFTRLLFNGELQQIEELVEKSEYQKITIKSKNKPQLELLIDRVVVKKEDEEAQYRIADSVQTAFFEGDGTCFIDIINSNEKVRKEFSDRFEVDGIKFEEPSVNFFTFNNPYGACKRCEGLGKILGIDKDLVIPDKSLSVYEGAIAPWRGEGMNQTFLKPLIANSMDMSFPIHRPYIDLDDWHKELLWTGNDYFQGLNTFFEYLESQTYKIQYRVMLSRYKGKTTCPECKGTRLRGDASYVKIGGKSIIDLVLMPISEVTKFFNQLKLNEFEEQVAQRLLIEIRNRLGYMERVGLGYLTLNRLTSTLSGGEFQRIKLATSLGSALVGSMYILDEPSIGLHPRDTENLISVLKQLRDLGNTVIVVEHEEEVMQAADQLIDIGPDAGIHGGELVFQGNVSNWQKNQKYDLAAASQSHTYRYLTGKETIEVPKRRRKWSDFIEVKGARENNLKNLNVKFPLGIMTVVTGVSGSGKSTLIKRVLYPALGKILGLVQDESGAYDKIEGSLKSINQIQFVDQNPIGKSSRSNPVTYIKAYDNIRALYSELPLSQQRGYKAGHFSFNIEGGRCETCQGEGEVTIEMQFMADIRLKCETCKGKRFKEETLEVIYKGKSISDILEMTIDEAVTFFSDTPKIGDALLPLSKVGLGYVRLGQSSNTLSGGEAQRIKLASFLVKGNVKSSDKILFIFDEPTTGLHFHDIHKLLTALNALVEQGHTVLIIEHNIEIIKSADWIIDLGQEGGDKGGYLCFEGTPEEMIDLENNHTARFLREKLK